MSERFVRLLKRILDSSLLLETPDTRWLFVTLLILADDANSEEIDMPLERLAARAGLSVQQTKFGLERLSEPDPLSRSTASEGRRLEPMPRPEGMAPRGWRIVNWAEQRKAFDAERAAARERGAARVRKHRDKKAGNGHVTPGNGSNAVDQDQDVDQDVDQDHEGERGNPAGAPPQPAPTKEKKNPRTVSPKMEPPSPAEVLAYFSEAGLSGSPSGFLDHYESTGWRTNGGAKIQNWKAAARKWSGREGTFGGASGSRGSSSSKPSKPAYSGAYANVHADIVSIDGVEYPADENGNAIIPAKAEDPAR